MSRSKPGAEPLPPLSAELKSGTQKQHDEAEGHGLHAVLFGSQGVAAAREAYARLLGQHLLIQESFEPLLRKAAGASGWGRVVREHHYHLAGLRDDCAVMGVTVDMLQPLPATARFIERIETLGRDDASGLLGVFYVFEGSTNGGTIIAMRVRELLSLHGEGGTRFINPHGQQVRPRWMEWKQGVDGLELTVEQRAAAIAGAQEAFTLSHAVLGDVAGAMTSAIGGKPQVVVLPIKAAKQTN
ncbi:MAG: biliverdin-producing heme oxygenase [Phycisphaerales bacterium]|nr:biliverdin-producing heme oxygenase [Phycisphaerales bacterium]